MRIIKSGKRKRAVAKAILKEGSGKVMINKKPFEKLHLFDKLKIAEPLELAKSVLNTLTFDAEISVRGGGEKSQVEAARVALSRAIIAFTGSKELNELFVAYDRNLLVADVRRKEAYKPGDSKARKKRQSSKR
ncbi:MAG: 30S ribosomal protein S9 [Nanoarchaeota archaeon]|nr:30S ribosomal protein S9 [Nanoarchaeota archaeon]